jgi:hypothetical protein
MMGLPGNQRWSNPGAERTFCRLALDSYKNAKAIDQIRVYSDRFLRFPFVKLHRKGIFVYRAFDEADWESSLSVALDGKMENGKKSAGPLIVEQVRSLFLFLKKECPPVKMLLWKKAKTKSEYTDNLTRSSNM